MDRQGRRPWGPSRVCETVKRSVLGGTVHMDPEECLLFYDQIHLVRCEVVPDQYGQRKHIGSENRRGEINDSFEGAWIREPSRMSTRLRLSV